MTFRNDEQRGRVAQALTGRLGKGTMWSPDAYGTPRQNALMKAHLKRCFTTVEASFVRLAWDVWNGSGKATFSVALLSFDSANLRLVGGLLVAIGAADGGEAVEAWILDTLDTLDYGTRKATR